MMHNATFAVLSIDCCPDGYYGMIPPKNLLAVMIGVSQSLNQFWLLYLKKISAIRLNLFGHRKLRHHQIIFF